MSRTTTIVRTAGAVALALLALGLAAFGLAAVYGFNEEYGGGSFGDLGIVVVLLPTLVAAAAVALAPRPGTVWRWGVTLVFAALLVAGGLVADSLGAGANHDRLVEESRTFACNGPNAELRVDPRVDETWRELPRPGLVYGPIEGTRTGCTAGVSGPAERTFPAFRDAFRRLDWQVRTDTAERFVMTRDGVTVTVARIGAPDQMTTVRVAVTD